MTNHTPLNIKKLLWQAHAQGLSHGFIPFWSGMLAEVIEKVEPNAAVIEFGTVSPEFLHLIYLAYPFQQSLGVILDIDAHQHTNSWEFPPHIQAKFIYESELNSITTNFDLAFSHEIFSLLPDLNEHANTIHRLLVPNSTYYAAFGWHTDNPYHSKHSELRTSQGQPFYPYSLDRVAMTFQSAGFEVGFKRLPMPYFMIYDPVLATRRFGNVASMIACLQEYKILFSFRKYDKQQLT